MALAAPALPPRRGLLDLLQQKVPLEERSLDIYRRLLAVNELAAAMNLAKDVRQLQDILASAYSEWMPEETIRLCVKHGTGYRRSRLSGPDIMAHESTSAAEQAMVDNVFECGAPHWTPDIASPVGSREAEWEAANSSARSMIVLPFTALGKLIGVLEWVSSRPNRFDEIDYQLAILVTAHFSSSLDNVLARQQLAAANARLRDHDIRLTQLNQQLQQLASMDDLTRLYNKRRLFEQIEGEIARARRYGETFSCLMIDLDNFKQINDSMGHEAGDEILRQVGSLLRSSFRITDFVARYGGEEFTVLLPRTGRGGALRVSESLLSELRFHEFVLPAAKVRLTASIGASSYTKLDQLDPKQVIVLADTALYQAKKTGKDRVCFAGEEELQPGVVNVLSAF